MGLGRYSYLPSGTTEAYEFLERVVQSGGTVDDNMSAATVTFFTSLVSNYLWDKIDVFYPIIGDAASAHAQGAGSKYINAYNLTFNGGWTHSPEGMTPDGINGYADSHYSPRAVVASNLVSFGAYLNETGYAGSVSWCN